MKEATPAGGEEKKTNSEEPPRGKGGDGGLPKRRATKLRMVSVVLPWVRIVMVY